MSATKRNEKSHVATAWKYELLVKSLYELLLKDKAVEVYHRRKLFGKRTQQKHEIDLSFSFTKIGINFLVLIECKCYAKNVGVDDIVEFAYKLRDIGAHKGIMVSTRGFQKGVFKVAKAEGIALVKINEPNTFDIIISTEGPGAYLYAISTEYAKTNIRRPPLAVLHSVRDDDNTPLLTYSSYYDSGNGARFGFWWEFIAHAWLTPQQFEQAEQLRR